MATEKKSFGTIVRVWIAEHLLLASAGLFTLVLLLGYVLVFAPQLHSLSEADRTQALESERTAKEAYLSQLQTLQKNFGALSAADLDRISQMVPPEEDLPGLLEMFEAMAAKADATVTSINFADGALTGAAAELKDVKAVDIAASVEHADYDRFKLFLGLVENNLRLLDVKGVSMNPAGARYELNVRTYVRTQ